MTSVGFTTSTSVSSASIIIGTTLFTLAVLLIALAYAKSKENNLNKNQEVKDGV